MNRAGAAGASDANGGAGAQGAKGDAGAAGDVSEHPLVGDTFGIVGKKTIET